ncbi:MAG: GMC family oxidoreductase [Oligoflexus sp.]|nr:GMC family oxidoreductase [Oligoflexus sp.]
MSQSTPIPSSVSRRSFIRASTVAGSMLTVAPAYGWTMSTKTYPLEHRQVIIIGSGFGGSITAARLAEKGVASLIIEQGRRWDNELKPGERRFSPNLYPNGNSTWLSHFTVVPLGPPLPIPRSTGVLQGRKLAGKTVLNGAAFGGGSITYGGVLVKPEEQIYKKVFPAEIPFSEMQRFYQKVGDKLSRGTIPDDVLNTDSFKHVRVAKKQCENADVEWELLHTGTHWDIVRDEIAGRIPASVIHGEAIYGVNSGAKATTNETYLKEAEATGLLEVRTLHQVQDIGQDPVTGFYTIEVNEINVRGKVIAKRSYSCEKLFLAAGTVGTTGLLVKAKTKGTLPKLNSEVGEGWGNNGNVYALRLGVGESTGQWQGGPPSIGIRDLENPLGPIYMEHPQLPLGVDISGLLYFGIGLNPTRGRFKYDESADKISIEWPEVDEGQNTINQAVLNTMNKMNQANGGFTTSLLTYLKDKVKDDICYHPLGGVVMGKAADFYGRVKGYEGLYVNDGSFLPGSSACTNPSLTISAFAERNIEDILANDFA